MLATEARRRFVGLIHRPLDVRSFFEAADRTLADLVQFDTSCWLGLDPATLLPTSHFTREVSSDHLLELAANEFLEEDVNKFVVLARASRPAATLSQATGWEPNRSARFTNILSRHGYQLGDELRAAFRSDGSVWGCVALHRRQGQFDDGEVALVAQVGSYLAQGIRRALATASATGPSNERAGFVLLRADNSIDSISATTGRVFNDLYDSTAGSGGVPLVVASLANKARLAASGETDEVASARIRTKGNRWFLFDALLLEPNEDKRVAVVVHSAKEPQIAQLIVEAYGLSAREQEVTRLVLQGLSTAEIADRLHVSPYTIQDHLKAVFSKAGVRSRRELVAHVFLAHYLPALQASGGKGSAESG